MVLTSLHTLGATPAEARAFTSAANTPDHHPNQTFLDHPPYNPQPTYTTATKSRRLATSQTTTNLLTQQTRLESRVLDRQDALPSRCTQQERPEEDPTCPELPTRHRTATPSRPRRPRKLPPRQSRGRTPPRHHPVSDPEPPESRHRGQSNAPGRGLPRLSREPRRIVTGLRLEICPVEDLLRATHSVRQPTPVPTHELQNPELGPAGG